MTAHESETFSAARVREYTAVELGRMNAEALRDIRHCNRCLEPYDRCVCEERKVRRGR